MSDGAYGGGPGQGRGGVRGFLQETLQEERPSLLAEDDMLDLLLQPVSIDLLAAPQLATEESDPFLASPKHSASRVPVKFATLRCATTPKRHPLSSFGIAGSDDTATIRVRRIDSLRQPPHRSQFTKQRVGLTVCLSIVALLGGALLLLRLSHRAIAQSALCTEMHGSGWSSPLESWTSISLPAPLDACCVASKESLKTSKRRAKASCVAVGRAGSWTFSHAKGEKWACCANRDVWLAPPWTGIAQDAVDVDAAFATLVAYGHGAEVHDAALAIEEGNAAHRHAQNLRGETSRDVATASTTRLADEESA